MAITNLGKPVNTNGLTNLHFARITKNDSEGYEGDKPLRYEGVNTITPAFTTTDNQYQADNKVYATESSITEGTLTIDVADTTPEFLEYALGYQLDDLALLTQATSGPELAVYAEITRPDGNSKFVHWGAVSFAPVTGAAQTGGSGFQARQLVGQIAAPSSGDIGPAGELVIDTASPAFKESGLTVDQAREKFFGNFLWKGDKDTPGDGGDKDPEPTLLNIKRVDDTELIPVTELHLGTNSTADIRVYYGTGESALLPISQYEIESSNEDMLTLMPYSSDVAVTSHSITGNVDIIVSYNGETLKIPVEIVDK